uniref:ATP-dependent RNA helicase n=1 Tax=Percolomonas cosmopolitus TaxID=63605 RepID=A0A7S1PH83_9EUKA
MFSHSKKLSTLSFTSKCTHSHSLLHSLESHHIHRTYATTQIKAINSTGAPMPSNPYQISFNRPQFISYPNPEVEFFPKSLTKAVIIKKPSTAEIEFSFDVPRVNQTVPQSLKVALSKNLSIKDISLYQQEMYGSIVLSVQDAIAKEYAKERNSFATGLQNWAHELWRTGKRVRLGTMFFLKKHQEHVTKALANGEDASKMDLCWQGPRGSGKSLGYLMAALETARCFKAWEQDYVQPGYRVLVLAPTNEHAKHLGSLLDAAVYGSISAEPSNPETAEIMSKLSNYKQTTKVQKELNAKRRAQAVEEQDDFAFMEYEGIMNLEAPDPHKAPEYSHINHIVLTNEGDLEQQIDAMDYETPEIVIATPDQLLKHVGNSNYFNNLKLLVLDDVNLLSGSFGKEIQDIKKHLRKGHRTVYVSDSLVEEIPENVKSVRPVDMVHISALKFHQKLALPHHVVGCESDGAVFDQVAALINQFRKKKIIITHQNNELLQLLHRMLEKHNIHTCLATELDESTDRDFALRYFNNRDNGVLLVQDYIALNKVNVDSADVLINIGDADSTQSTYIQLFDLLHANAEGSFLLTPRKVGAKQLSSLHSGVEFKDKPLTQAKRIRDQGKIDEAASEAHMQTSASIVNYYRNLLASPKDGQWLKNQIPPRFLGALQGADGENAKEAVAKTVELYNVLGLSKESVPRSSVYQAQAVGAENAMREAGLSKWFYHRHAQKLLKVPPTFE